MIISTKQSLQLSLSVHTHTHTHTHTQAHTEIHIYTHTGRTQNHMKHFNQAYTQFEGG